MTAESGKPAGTAVARPGRAVAGTVLLVTLLVLVASDLFISSPIDPYLVPWPTALGSGAAPSGALCTDISGLLP